MKTSYAYSLKTERVREKDFPYNGNEISCTKELVDFAKKLQDSDIEKMIVVYLDAQNKLTGILPIMGTVNQAVVYPREVLKHALLCSAANIILIHNHPSGNCRPSESDIPLTKTIKDTARVLGLDVLDHLIIAGEKFFSFREEGLIF